MLLATTVFSKRARVAFRETRETIGDVSAELQENISGVREVQAFARERGERGRVPAVNASNRDANVQAADPDLGLFARARRPEHHCPGHRGRLRRLSGPGLQRRRWSPWA